MHDANEDRVKFKFEIGELCELYHPNFVNSNPISNTIYSQANGSLGIILDIESRRNGCVFYKWFSQKLQKTLRVYEQELRKV